MAQTDQLFMLIMMASFQICTVPGSDFTKKSKSEFFLKDMIIFFVKSESFFNIVRRVCLLRCKKPMSKLSCLPGGSKYKFTT